jgi:hypothetical protein
MRETRETFTRETFTTYDDKDRPMTQETPNKKLNIALWVVQVVLAALYLMA